MKINKRISMLIHPQSGRGKSPIVYKSSMFEVKEYKYLGILINQYLKSYNHHYYIKSKFKH